MENILINVFIIFVCILLSICAHMWKPEDDLCFSALSLHLVGPRD